MFLKQMQFIHMYLFIGKNIIQYLLYPRLRDFTKTKTLSLHPESLIEFGEETDIEMQLDNYVIVIMISRVKYRVQEA